MKKMKLPGENISLKTKKNESDEVMAWINSQSNLMDSIRYLIENEVRLHGVRNLQHFVPPDRSTPDAAGLMPAWARAEVAAAAEHAAALAAYAQARASEAEPQVPAAGQGQPLPAAARTDEVADEDIDSWM